MVWILVGRGYQFWGLKCSVHCPFRSRISWFTQVSHPQWRNFPHKLQKQSDKPSWGNGYSHLWESLYQSKPFFLQCCSPIVECSRQSSKSRCKFCSVKVDESNMEEAQLEVQSILRRIRGLRPEEPDNFAINQQEAFETQYKAIKLAIGGTGIFITV